VFCETEPAVAFSGATPLRFEVLRFFRSGAVPRSDPPF
jgi:hypothetical protein